METFTVSHGVASTASSGPASKLAPTPERYTAAFRDARTLGRQGNLSLEQVAAQVKAKHSLGTFSKGTVRKAKAKGSRTPQGRGRKSSIPPAVERDVAHTVRAVRSLNLPVFKADIFMWVHAACEGIEGITMPANMDKWCPGIPRWPGRSFGRPPGCCPLEHSILTLAAHQLFSLFVLPIHALASYIP